MRFFCFLLFLILCVANMAAQDFDSDFTTETYLIGPKEENRLRDILGSSEFGVYFYKRHNNEESLLLIDYSGNIVAEKVVDLDDGTDQRVFYRFLISDKKLYLVYEIEEKTTKTRKLEVEVWDASNLESLGMLYTREDEFIDNRLPTKPNSTVQGMRISEAIEEDFAFSPDNKKLALYVSPFKGDRIAMEKLRVAVIDIASGKITDKEWTMSVPCGEWDLQNMILSNEGEVFVMCANRKDLFNRDALVRRMVVQFSNNLEEVNTIVLPDEIKLLRGFSWDLREDGKLEFFGYIGAENQILKEKKYIMGINPAYASFKIAGAEIIVVNPKTQTIDERYANPFTEDLLREMTSLVEEQSKEKNSDEGGLNEAGIKDLTARQLIKFSDGTSFLVGEVYVPYVQQGVTIGGGGGSGTMSKYGDIVVMKFDKFNNALWNVRIPKNQKASSETFLGYVFDYNNGGLTFYFNDHPDNCNPVERKRVKAYTGGNSSQVHICKVSGDGLLSEFAVPTNENGEARIRPSKTAILPMGGIYFVESENELYYSRFVFEK